MPDRRRKLLFFVSEDWYFCSHRLPIAIAAKDAGYDVVVATRVGDLAGRIVGAGLRLVPFEMRRRSMNPFLELAVLWRLWQVYRREQPDLVHHVSLKPVLYGSIVARLAGVRGVVNAMAGLGILFSSLSWKARLLRLPVRYVLRWLLNGRDERLILQNPDDVATMVAMKIARSERVRLIRGAGVDLSEYVMRPEPDGPVRVLLVGRMLWAKGVGVLVDAARLLHKAGVQVRFVLVGEPDEGNPASITAERLRGWEAEGVIEWLGKRNDVAALYADCHIACLPSFYGEGIPKSLLEAAACGRSIVTTDAPGCREVVRDGDNGLLVPVRDPQALAAALVRLIDDPALRQRMGARGRARAEAEFAVDAVIQQTLAVYEEVCPK